MIPKADRPPTVPFSCIEPDLEAIIPENGSHRSPREEKIRMNESKRGREMRIFGAGLMAVLFASPLVFGQPAGADIVIGKRIPLPSKVLNTEIVLSVSLPANYETSGTKYPVIYDLNGFAYFTYGAGTVELLSRNLEMPEMIVVGLPNLQAGYVPTAYEQRGSEPTAADLSLKFISDELLPFIDGKYRTTGFNLLCGHSVAGLFTMYALFTRPDLFSAGIASSPWFQANDQYWLRQIDKMFQAGSLAGKRLFMTVGKEEQDLTISTYTELEKWMGSKDLKGLTWKSAWIESVDHSSMIGKSLYDGLLFIFEGWKIPFDAVLSGDVSAIQEHADRTRAKFGDRLPYDIPENLLNQIGYQLLSRKTYDRALALFTLNVKIHGDSPNAFDSLAECYLTMGDKEKARQYYALAIQKNPGRTDYEKRILQNAKDKLKELDR
jgi:predicted alpha/beta superfamily hydrolase